MRTMYLCRFDIRVPRRTSSSWRLSPSWASWRSSRSVWRVRYSFAVNRLSRGIGQTMFYGADGKPWFPLEEHRRDVPLNRISPHLQDAVVAIEDHRFRSHLGIDPIGIGRANRSRSESRRHRRRRQHADPAAGAHAVSVRLARFHPQMERNRPRADDRTTPLQAADSGAVPEPHLPRRRRLRRRGDVAERVRKERGRI